MSQAKEALLMTLDDLVVYSGSVQLPTGLCGGEAA